MHRDFNRIVERPGNVFLSPICRKRSMSSCRHGVARRHRRPTVCGSTFCRSRLIPSRFGKNRMAEPDRRAVTDE
jgi:hypothetical protein